MKEAQSRRQEARVLAWAERQVRLYPLWLALIDRAGYGRMIRRALADLPPGLHRLLDIGTGTGIAARFAAEILPEVSVFALDLSMAFLRKAATKACRAPLVRASAVCLPFRERSFDMATSFGVLCHAADPAAAVSEMGRVLRPGGRALLWTRGKGPSGQILRLLFPISSLGARFFLYSADDLDRLFARAGFADIRVRPAAQGLLVSARRPAPA